MMSLRERIRDATPIDLAVAYLRGRGKEPVTQTGVGALFVERREAGLGVTILTTDGAEVRESTLVVPAGDVPKLIEQIRAKSMVDETRD